MKPVKKSLAKFLNGSCFVLTDYKKKRKDEAVLPLGRASKITS
jgi:hypothetical protein